MATKTKTKRGEILTPELQEQLTNYYPLIRKMAFNARAKYRKNLPEITLDDWRSELTLAAVRMAPCWQPSKGCFGTLIKVGLGNIIKNKVRDHIKRNKMLPMTDQGHDLLPLNPTKFQDVLTELDAKESTDEARELLEEVRSDIADANGFSERLNLVKDFLGSVQPDWLHSRQSKEIGELLGCTATLVQRARGIPAADAKKPAPEPPVTIDPPVVEPTPCSEPEAPVRPPNRRGKRWTVPGYLPTEEDPFAGVATIDVRPTGQPRRRYGLNQASTRWLVWRSC